MSSIKKIERNRGLKESREQIKVLQDKWPGQRAPRQRRPGRRAAGFQRGQPAQDRRQEDGQHNFHTSEKNDGRSQLMREVRSGGGAISHKGRTWNISLRCCASA